MLNLSDWPPYRDLGNLVAAGVAVALALTFVALPALLLVLPVPHRGSGQWLQRLVQAFGAFVLRRRTVILAGGACLVVAVSALIPLNRLGEKWYQNLDSRYETRQAIDAISARMGATHAIYYTLDSGSGGGVNEPDYLRTVDAFAAWLEQQPAVEGTAKLTDLVKRMNRVMNGDEPAFYAIPDRRDLVAQYLFLYELFAPPGLGLGDTVDVDRAASRLMVRVDKSDSQALLDLDHRAQEWLRENAPGLRVSVGSGLDMAFAHINQSNIVGLLEGMVLALVLISALVVVFLRSVRLGVVGMLTNLAPAGLAFGIWGLAVGNVDLAASVVMCMSLGIVVDDTVHILSKYLAARRGWGAAPAEAMDYVFRTVGVAVVVTTIVLVVGFLLLLFAAFSPTRTVGLLNALTIALALAVDLMLVPPILLALDRDGPNAERRRRFTWPDIVTKVGHAPGLGRGP
jgi:predicted RND superfamily exporter protein